MFITQTNLAGLEIHWQYVGSNFIIVDNVSSVPGVRAHGSSARSFIITSRTSLASQLKMPGAAKQGGCRTHFGSNVDLEAC